MEQVYFWYLYHSCHQGEWFVWRWSMHWMRLLRLQKTAPGLVHDECRGGGSGACVGIIKNHSVSDACKLWSTLLTRSHSDSIHPMYHWMGSGVGKNELASIARSDLFQTVSNTKSALRSSSAKILMIEFHDRLIWEIFGTEKKHEPAHTMQLFGWLKYAVCSVCDLRCFWSHIPSKQLLDYRSLYSQMNKFMLQRCLKWHIFPWWRMCENVDVR